MTTIEARYDASASAYRQWWEPVLAASARELLDRLEQAGGPPAGRLLDVGTGAGLLAIEAVRRWPELRVTGLDGSAEMLAVAEAAAQASLDPTHQARLTWLRGHAGRLPFDDGSFDLVVSSFVYQLVPNLTAALAEAHRVIRPDGRFGLVTWQVAEEPFAPDEAFEAALDDLELDFDDEEPEEARSGDLASARATATRLRRLGFRDVQAREAWLEYQHDPATYGAFLEGYAERELFAGLEPGDRDRLRALTSARLARLEPAAFRWRVPVIYALARRPALGGP
ncbi:MAG TPA: class I SAM-dependent methyltransferase [Candidatus Limnocylindrales bacterium]